MPLDIASTPTATIECDEAQPVLDHCQLFCSALLRVEGVVARPATARPSRERELADHSIVLPYQGLFATHASRRHAVLASTSHAVLLSARTPYRYSYPGAIGDRCVVLMWSDEALERVAPAALRHGRFDTSGPAAAPVLEPTALLARERLRHLLEEPTVDPLAVEEEAMGLLASVLRVVQLEPVARTTRSGSATARNHARVERIKALVAAGPARRWTLAELAAAAAVSPYHLAHLFKMRVGLSVYEYVVRARLAATLERVLDSQLDLTTIAMDAGFSSHSHFTAQFRTRFGTTPFELRRQGARRSSGEVRRISTAHQGAAS
jgi:AraC family transcriptional regulator